jgi:Domain of unknown function (DUF4166)
MLRRIVLIGATGFFGRRLAQRLAAIEGVELVITSRTEARARELARILEGNAKITAFTFDRDDASSLARLKTLSSWLVIDASGPFQSASYELARVAIGLGAHWIDLADARDYLLGFGAALDQIARDKGVVARAGASSTPALSMAVVEELTRGWQRLDGVDIAIMPGGAGNVGEAVIGAILSYVGSAISGFSEGSPSQLTGWGSLRRVTIDDLGTRYLSPVETVDTDLMQQRFAVASRVSFNAGLESRIEQFGLFGLARLRKAGAVSSLDALAPLLAKSRTMTRVFASDRGGMIVDCSGLDSRGQQISSRWSLHAEKGHGPDVPVLPAVALTRALLRGEGKAGAAIAMLPLKDVEAEMSPPSLMTSRTSRIGGGHSLIASACGEDNYRLLPSALRAFHDQNAPPVWTGKANIDASTSIAGRFLRVLFGFPPSGRNVPVTVTVDRYGDGETWTRNFDGKRFASRLTYEGGSIVSERFGPFRILLSLGARGGEIQMPVIGWQVGRIRLPLFLAPKSETPEFVGDDGRFHFDVAISVPLVGLLAHYRGWLAPRVAVAREPLDSI